MRDIAPMNTGFSVLHLEKRSRLNWSLLLLVLIDWNENRKFVS